MRYQFIREHQGQFRSTILFRMLGVCASAFYQWQKRPVSQRFQQKRHLMTLIHELFEQSQGRYGSPRIHQDLQALGIRCSQNRVAQLMKELNLVVTKARRFVVTTDSGHAFPIA
jgi:transposase InsO family protein